MVEVVGEVGQRGIQDLGVDVPIPRQDLYPRTVSVKPNQHDNESVPCHSTTIPGACHAQSTSPDYFR